MTPCEAIVLFVFM